MTIFPITSGPDSLSDSVENQKNLTQFQGQGKKMGQIFPSHFCYNTPEYNIFFVLQVIGKNKFRQIRNLRLRAHPSFLHNRCFLDGLNDEIQTGPGAFTPGPVCLGLFALCQI